MEKYYPPTFNNNSGALSLFLNISNSLEHPEPVDYIVWVSTFKLIVLIVTVSMHKDLSKMTDILQTTFYNALCSMRGFVFD